MVIECCSPSSRYVDFDDFESIDGVSIASVINDCDIAAIHPESTTPCIVPTIRAAERANDHLAIDENNLDPPVILRRYSSELLLCILQMLNLNRISGESSHMFPPNSTE